MKIYTHPLVLMGPELPVGRYTPTFRQSFWLCPFLAKRQKLSEFFGQSYKYAEICELPLGAWVYEPQDLTGQQFFGWIDLIYELT